MVIWYKNSILASIMSITGCSFILFAVYGLIDGAYSADSLIVAIVIGIALAVGGNFVSKRKAAKQQNQ